MQKKAPIFDKPWAAFGGHKLAQRGLGPNGPDALRGLVLSKAVRKRTGVTCRRLWGRVCRFLGQPERPVGDVYTLVSQDVAVPADAGTISGKIFGTG